ncbi:MAG: cation-translocating P-type ATPase [Planctomycetota bacterium]|nr:cation-translocating P-type ATPase [Planctomycetota bacterium]
MANTSAHAGHDHSHDHDHAHGHDHSHAGHSHAGHSHAGHSHAKGPDPSRTDKSYIECCNHEAEVEKYLRVYLVGGVFVLVTAVLDWFTLSHESLTQIPAMIGAVLLSIPLLKAAWTELKAGKPSSSTLAGVAILAAIANGDYVTAGMLAFILLFIGLLVRRTAFGAQRAIAELVTLTPDIARVIVDGQEQEVPLSRVQVGQVVRVRPGENLPVDGKILTGRTTVNQASLTGEAAPVELSVNDPVYAGTTNLTGGIDIQVTQVGADTTIGKVTSLIRSAEQSRSPRQLLIEQVAQFFVPVALALAAVVWFLKSQNPATRDEAATTAITVLVVTCPVSLLLASPTAMLAAFAACARLGIMVKEPAFLEGAANIDTVVFDKTGTITTGKFQVTKLAPAPGVEGAQLLRAAALGEQHSNHPLAQSIMTTARAARLAIDPADDYEEIHGRGVLTRTSAGELRVGRASWLLEINPAIREQFEQVEKSIEGMSGVHVMLGDRYLGAVGLEDTIRPNFKGVMSRLRELGVKYVALFTGDRLSVAKRVGAAVGVDAIEAECLPEEKHEQIKNLVSSGRRTLMVGDGINDGPSLAAADVGVAMGLSGSDIAANSAGVALMNDDLSRVPFLIEAARRTRSIVTQNIVASIVIIIVGLILASTGVLSAAGKAALPLAGLYHFVGEIFVLGNSFRLFRFGEEFHAAEQEKPKQQRRAASVRLSAPQPA